MDVDSKYDAFREIREEYINHLEKIHGIRTAAEYFIHIRAYHKTNDAIEFRENIEESDFDLRMLFQILPPLDQKVFLLSTNPGLHNNMSTDVFAENRGFGRRQRLGIDIQAHAEDAAKHLHGYLSKSNGFSKIIPRLQDGLDLLTSTDEVPFEEYIRPNQIESGASNLFSETFYDRIYKFPSYDENALMSADIRLGRRTFQTEVDELFDPRVIVATGKVSWQAVYKAINSEDIISHNDSHVTCDFKKYDKGGARGGVYEIPSRGLWVLTTRHGSYYPNSERLEENIRYVNERL